MSVQLRSPEELLRIIDAAVQMDELPAGPLYAPVQYILNLPGKRSRPLLVALAYQAYATQPVERVMPVALAVEYFHNFTLMHDDIMDQAPTRRGQPSVHIQWDVNTAILSGDALFAESVVKLLAAPGNVADLTRTFLQAAIEVCQGQMDDMLLEKRDADVTLAEYIEMIRRKTAVLLGASLRLGALAGGASPEEAQRLDQIGQLAGIAFQLQDDELDTYADPEKFGKQPGGDILQNKKTCLWIYTAESGGRDVQAQLAHWADRNEDPAAKVQAVKALFAQAGAREYCQQLQQDYFGRAFGLFDQLEGRSGLEPLLTYLGWMRNRQY